ncbi:MAG: c-type cytochrome [Bacteroidota bacterium]|nr:c-type cytochrome [Bacteroidota bacterium]
MPFLEFKKLKLLGTLGAVFAASPLWAQTTDTAAQTPPASSGSNMLEILLVVMMIILVFVIWGLGQVLMVLGKQVIEKNKNAAKSAAMLLIGLLMLTPFHAWAQDSTKVAAAPAVSNYGGLSPTAFYVMVMVFAIEIIIIFFMAFFIRRFSAELLPRKVRPEGKKSGLRSWWSRFDKMVLTRATPVAQEADVLLDHDYDGIRELDNPLPPWWKYGFYITIGVAVVYLFYFQVFGIGKNPAQEYQAEMAQARIEKAAYDATNKDKIDEDHVPMADAAGLAKAKGIFETKCFVCHGQLGEGGVGPNLTDNYWIHKGSLNDIYKSIMHGYPDKGMPAWSSFYTPKEISYLASYVITLHGTNPPNAKAPQGELYVSEPSTGSAADSTKKPEEKTRK